LAILVHRVPTVTVQAAAQAHRKVEEKSMKNQDIDVYKRLKVFSMSQQELIVFLYESSLSLLDEAKEKIAVNDVPGTHDKLNRARNIFLHLLSTLNVEVEDEFGKKLSSLYAFFIEKITVANVTKNKQEIDDIIPLISDIRDAWANTKFDENDPSLEKKGTESFQAVSLEV
jgi:flagellar secretion chaperone FliS